MRKNTLIITDNGKCYTCGDGDYGNSNIPKYLSPGPLLIPSHWTVQFHMYTSFVTREIVKTCFILHSVDKTTEKKRYPDCPISWLPMEILTYICEFLPTYQ